MPKMAYGVFIGSKFGITTNKRTAIRAVRNAGRGTVRAITWGFYCDCSAWDGPTFAAQSDFVFGNPMAFDTSAKV